MRQKHRGCGSQQSGLNMSGGSRSAFGLAGRAKFPSGKPDFERLEINAPEIFPKRAGFICRAGMGGDGLGMQGKLPDRAAFWPISGRPRARRKLSQVAEAWGRWRVVKFENRKSSDRLESWRLGVWRLAAPVRLWLRLWLWLWLRLRLRHGSSRAAKSPPPRRSFGWLRRAQGRSGAQA